MIDKTALERLISLDDVNESIGEIYFGICDFTENGGSLEKINDSQKTVFFVIQLELEVDNGGFHQYLWNFTGDNAHEALAALRTIKAENTANILQRVIDLFPDKKKTNDIDLRQEIMDEMEDELNSALDPLDSEFYDYPDYLRDLCMDYIKEHQDKFYV
jgi:hypothetical protein